MIKGNVKQREREGLEKEEGHIALNRRKCKEKKWKLRVERKCKDMEL